MMNEKALVECLCFLYASDEEERKKIKDLVSRDTGVVERLEKELAEASSPIEWILFRANFGLDDREPRTLLSLAEEYHVTRERIRQIVQKVCIRLKHPVRRQEIIS